MTMPSQRSIVYPCWLRISVGKDPAQIVFVLQHAQKFEGIVEVIWTNTTHRHGLPVAVVEVRFKNRTLCEAFADSLPPSLSIQEPVIYSNAVYVRAQITAAYEDAMAGLQRLDTILTRYDGEERIASNTRWMKAHYQDFAAWRAELENVIHNVVKSHGGLG